MNPVLCIHVPDSSLYIICVFYSSRIRTLVAMVTLSFHRLIMGKVEISYFFENYCSLRSEKWWMQTTNGLDEGICLI